MSTPGEQRVLIIGSGVAGLSALKAYKAAGYGKVECFDGAADLGGVWTRVDYPDLHTHSKAYNYRFVGFSEIVAAGERATAAEVAGYIRTYAQAHDLIPSIHLRRRVVAITYHSEAPRRRCSVDWVDLETEITHTQDYDLVVCALGFSNGGVPHMPQFPGRAQFQGTLIHSEEFSSEALEDIVTSGQRVVIVGAGKSAQDIACSLLRRGHKELVCVYRKALWSYGFEFMYRKKSLADMALIGYAYSLGKIRRKLGVWTPWLQRLSAPLVRSGFLCNPFEPDSDIFLHRGAVARSQDIALMAKMEHLRDGVARLSPDGVETVSGRSLGADYVICATGYERGANVPVISVVDHKGKRELDPRERPALFRFMIEPELPELALFASEIIFPQQAFGFSIAAEWLARFHAGRLRRNFDRPKMEQDLTRRRGDTAWNPGDRYLSRGMPYSFEVNHIIPMLGEIFSDLGLPERWARHCYRDFNDPAKFDRLCQQLAHRLEQEKKCSVRRPGGPRPLEPDGMDA